MAQFRPVRHPDLFDSVTHLTGRPSAVFGGSELDPRGRLASILEARTIVGSRPYGAPSPVVCFTESTPQGLEFLVSELRYAPWGIMFKKDSVWAKGSSLALYVRSDEYDLLSSTTTTFRSRGRAPRTRSVGMAARARVADAVRTIHLQTRGRCRSFGRKLPLGAPCPRCASTCGTGFAICGLSVVVPLSWSFCVLLGAISFALFVWRKDLRRTNPGPSRSRATRNARLSEQPAGAECLPRGRLEVGLLEGEAALQ